MKIGFHASHEQFSPGALLDLAVAAEQAGFDAIKCSDHFHPWSERQAQSGFAWSWLGAALARTQLPFGTITAPGYRYHPAIVAQAIATLAEMFPRRLWTALGSGQAINEAITGEAWPEKPERNARLAECVEIIRRLLRGETVTHRGRVTVIEARVYSLPPMVPPLFGAAVTPETAAFVGTWADGLLTTGGDPASVARVVQAFRSGGGEGKPVMIQHALSWATTSDQAFAQAIDQWAGAAAGGEVNWDLRRPADFDRIGRMVGRQHIGEMVAVSADLDEQAARIASYAELGADTVYLHNVGTNQRPFIEAFGAHVLPKLRGLTSPSSISMT
ncbi:MAG: TIGR03885 family FMN-dependent LLM class oxidoreductase [Devosia sp.]